MSNLMHGIINGIATGSIYALIALALSLVFSTAHIINFAHGELVMLGGVLAYVCMRYTGLSYVPSVLLAFAGVAVVGLCIYFLLIKPLPRFSMGWMLTTLGASLLLRDIVEIGFGGEPQAFPFIGGRTYVEILGWRLFVHEVIMILVGVVVGLLLQWFLYFTFTGKAVRAVATSHEVSRLVGINPTKIIMLCFGLSGIVAGIAGILIAPITFVSASMTLSVGLSGMAAAVLGGMGNYVGAFIGGWIIGVIQSFAGWFLSSEIKDAVTLALMIVALLVFPGGITSAKTAFARSKT